LCRARLILVGGVSLIGEISGLSCAAAWAVISLIMRSLADHMRPVVVNGLRCLFAAITLAAVVVLTGRTHSLLTMPEGVVWAIVVSGVLGQAVGDAAFVRSAKLIGASRALPLSSSAPLFTMFLAALLLGESVNAANVLGTITVIAGVVLLAIPYGPILSAQVFATADRGGLLLAFFAAVCYAVSTVVLKSGIADVDVLAANFVRMSTAAALLTGLELVQSGAKVPVGLSRRTLAVMTVTGLISAFSSSMYVTSVQYAGAAKASILTSTSPLFGLPLALIFLHERINSRIAIGTVASVIGIWLVLWR
jgi:DME family drug/metabolite transporter